MLTYINVSAEFVGVDKNFSAYLVSISNAGAAVGRIIAGLSADRYGRLVVLLTTYTPAYKPLSGQGLLRS